MDFKIIYIWNWKCLKLLKRLTLEVNEDLLLKFKHLMATGDVSIILSFVILKKKIEDDWQFYTIKYTPSI